MPIKKPASRKRTRPAAKPGGRSSKPASRKTASRRKSQPAPPPGLWQSMSPDRRMDVVGLGLIAVGLLTLLSLLSASQSSLTGGWIFLLTRLLGWGVWVFPVGLLGLGGWMVLRRVENIPPFSIERVTGIILLYLWLLPTLHYIGADPQYAVQLADLGQGGGYLGSLFLRLLWVGLGTAGALIFLAAWLLIALTLTLDISIQELAARTAPFFARLGAGFRALFGRLRGAAAHMAGGDDRSLPDEFTPLQRAGAAPPPPPENAPFPVAAVPSEGGQAIRWVLPQARQILEAGLAPAANEEFVEQRARLIEDTLASLGSPVQVVEINRGPSITQFGVEPLFIETRTGRTRVRVGKIAALADDLALALAAPRIRIQAPVPGHSYVGIEVPNEEMTLVALRDIVESESFARLRSPLRLGLGRDVAGHPIVADLTGMPHLLIAGTTGSGKSVCVNAILTALLLQNSPDDLRLVLVDPKRVELTSYNGVPHLLAPVVVEIERVVGALQWMTREMDKRYHTFAQSGARNIIDYNARMQAGGGKKLPYLVVVIDELADLMMIAPEETERTITRLAQLARATGIHLILATQRPSVDVLTGLIKANFPARIAFAVASGVDSRVILDHPGAERLLGRGDMLYQAPESPAPLRLQGVFVSDAEIQALVEFWRRQAGTASPYAIAGGPVDLPAAGGVPLKQTALFEEVQPGGSGDALTDEAIDIVRREGRASVSMLQRKLRIGYTRAARLIDTLEEKGIVGPPEGQTQVRQVLDYGPAAPPPEEG